MQSSVSRKKKGSRNRKKARIQLAKPCRKVRLQRDDYSFRPLLEHITNAFDSNNKTDRILFNGKLNIQTRKVSISVGSVLMSVDVPPLM